MYTCAKRHVAVTSGPYSATSWTCTMAYPPRERGRQVEDQPANGLKGRNDE